MHPYTPRYRTVMRAYESGFPRKTLLGSLVNKDRRMGQSLSHEQDICPHHCMRLRPYTEAGSSLKDTLIMPDKPVALADFCSGPPMLVLTYLSRCEFRRDLLVLIEEGLEPARRENLHNPDGLSVRVAQGMGHPPRLEHVGAYRRDHDLAADVARQLALQHHVALVLAGVGVRGYHLAGRKAPLEDRKSAAGALRRDLVYYVQDGKVSAMIRTDEDLLMLLRCHGMLPSSWHTRRRRHTHKRSLVHPLNRQSLETSESSRARQFG